MAEHSFTVAVDLDGTLTQAAEYDSERIASPREGAKETLEWLQDQGARIVIFTVRDDRSLIEDWLEKHEIPYDYINENPDQPESTSGKVMADCYLDDRAISAGADRSWPEIKAELQEKMELAEPEDAESDDEEESERLITPDRAHKLRRFALTIMVVNRAS